MVRTIGRLVWPGASRVFVVICFTLLLVGIALAQTPRQAPLNPKFLEYQRHPQAIKADTEGHSLGLVPEPIDFSYLKAMPRKTRTALPASYSLRTLGRLTDVRNQNPAGTCWAFATMSSLESCQMPGETPDFSENNLKNNSGFDWDPNSGGGNRSMSAAYLARWSGPVNEADDPYNPSTTTSPSATVRKHVQHIIYLPNRTGSLDNDTIKQAVMDYGAVYSHMMWDGNYHNYTTYSYYYNGTAGSNHAIAIVGWDDNYSASNFKTAPPGNGAFLIRNSWGASWGNGGYFYISYYDTVIGSSNTIFYNAESTTNYQRVYQYDTLGATGSYGYTGSNTAWFANVFDAVANEYLTAVSWFVASPGSTYEIRVYMDPASGPLNSNGPVLTQAGTNETAGYHTVILSTPVALTNGHKFSVVVKHTTPGYTYPIPMERPYANYSMRATASAGQSYYSYAGTTWTDFNAPTNSNTNICLKAFTSTSVYAQPQPDLLLRKHGTTTFTGNNLYNLLSEQTVSQSAVSGYPATYDVQIQNDGGTADTITIAAGAPLSSRWDVLYFDALTGGTDITSLVEGDGWQVSLATGGTKDIRVVVTPSPTTGAGSAYEFTLYATSGSDNSKTDSVDLATSALAALSAVTLEANTDSPCPASTSIGLTATATGGGTVEYRFMVSSGGVWSTLRDYAQSNTCTWKPTTAGSYNLKVQAREVGSTAEYDVISSSLAFTITSPLTAVSLTPDVASPQIAGTTINLTALATGGASVEYLFQVSKSPGTTLTTLQAYSSDNTYTWTPTQDGTYSLKVSAREAAATSTVVTKTITYVVTPSLSAVTLAITPASPQPVNTTMTLTAASTGGVSVQYQFEVSADGTTWTTLRSYATGTKASWMPTTAGTYSLRVKAREGDSGTPVTSSVASFVITGLPPTAVSLSASPVSPQPVQTAITLTASATGGTTVEYQFLVCPSGGSWTTLQDFSTTRTCTWTPTTDSRYTVKVVAREQGLTTRTVFKTIIYTVTDQLSAVSLTTSLLSAQPINTAITLTGKATGGANVQYQFEVSADGTTWTTLRSYATGATASWKPTSAGTYSLRVKAREGDSGTPVTSSVTSYVITNAPPTAVLLSASPVSPQPVQTAVALTAAATGGTTVEYQFLVCPSGGSWTTLQDFSTTRTCTWTPITDSNYSVKVVVREQGLTSRTVSATMVYMVTEVLTAVSLTAAPSPAQPINTSINLTGTATGGANVQYLFEVSTNGTTWTTCRAYSTAKTAAWRPTTSGTYSLRVSAREGATGTPVTSTVISYLITPAPPIAVALRANPISPRPVNTTIALSVITTGGTNVDYKFSANRSGVITVLQDYSTASTCTWTPTVSGNYQLYVDVREHGLTKATTGRLSYLITPVLTGVKLTTKQPAAIPIRTPVTLTATKINGANAQFQFEVSTDGGTTWTVARAYSTVATAIWMPTTVGSYRVRAQAREGSTGTPVASNILAFTVTPTPPTGVLLAVSPASPQYTNTSVTLTATKVGGTNVEYKFEVAKSPTTTWTVLQSYATVTACSWTPTTAGTYRLRVTAREQGLTQTVFRMVEYKVYTPLTAVTLTVSPTSPRPVNTTITMTARANGGASVRYQFEYSTDGGTNWTVLRAYSTSASAAWRPTQANTYTLRVRARDGASGTPVSSANATYVISSP